MTKVSSVNDSSGIHRRALKLSNEMDSLFFLRIDLHLYRRITFFYCNHFSISLGHSLLSLHKICSIVFSHDNSTIKNDVVCRWGDRLDISICLSKVQLLQLFAIT